MPAEWIMNTDAYKRLSLKKGGLCRGLESRQITTTLEYGLRAATGSPAFTATRGRLAGQGRPNHRCRAADAAFHRDGRGGTIALASAALHAGFGMRQLGDVVALRKHRMWADGAAHPATDATTWLIEQRIENIHIAHFNPPADERMSRSRQGRYPRQKTRPSFVYRQTSRAVRRFWR